MTEDLLTISTRTAAVPATLTAEPFLHYSADRIYNTITDQSLLAAEPGSK